MEAAERCVQGIMKFMHTHHQASYTAILNIHYIPLLVPGAYSTVRTTRANMIAYAQHTVAAKQERIAPL